MSTRPRIFSSFVFLNVVQFLGALNDNLFKIVIVFLAISIQGTDHSNIALVLTGAAFVLPFLLFSLPAGILADRHSKRNITVITKILEVIIMLLGVFVFSLQAVWGGYLVLFLMATQSALFGPSKYGLVPELVRPDQIATANGILMALTVIATILGSFLASVFTTLTDHDFVAVAWIAVGIAVTGLIASLLIEKTPAVGSQRRIRFNVLADLVRVLRQAHKQSYLIASLLGTSFFFLVGAFVQLNIITFAIQSLDLTPVKGNYLFTVTSIGIALGAYLVGKLSGAEVELGYSPLAGLLLALGLLLLLPLQHFLWAATICLFLLGLFGGIYLVPFDAYIQIATPQSYRGETIAAGNFLSFVGVALATLLLYVFGDVFRFSGAEGFFIFGVLTLIAAICFAFRMSDSLVRLTSRSRFPLHLRKVIGKELISPDQPTLYTCVTTDWYSSFIRLITLQQRYMRFLVEQPSSLSASQRLVARLAKVAFFRAPLTSEHPAYAKATRWLKRGYSLTVISSPPSATDQQAQTQALAASFSLSVLTIDTTDLSSGQFRLQEQSVSD